MVIAAIAAIAAVGAPAAAQRTTPKPKAKAKAPPAESKPAPQPEVTPPAWLFAPPAATTTESEVRPLDLGPSRLFKTGSPRLLNRRSNEKGALRFGDGTWKSHALQVGGMVAGFAALAALCGTSRCMLPKGLGSWVPGTTTEAPPAPARVGPRLEGLPRAHR
jgi:hypothetical protein